MDHSLLRTGFIAWILVSGLPCRTQAQPPTRQQLRATLQRLSAQVAVGNQTEMLQNWQRQWQQGGHPPDSTYVSGLLMLGLAHLYQSQYPASTRVVRQAVRLSQARRPDIAEDQPAKALYRLGMLLVDQNQPSIDTLKKAVRQGQTIRSADRWVGGAYLYLSYAYYSAGDFQQALNSAERGEQTVRKTTDRALLAKLLQEKANALNILEQYGLAHQAAQEAVGLSQQDGYRELTARGYRLLGDIAKNQRQLSDALRYYQRAFRTAPPHDPTIPNYAVSVGMLYYQLRQYERAIPYFKFGVDRNTNSYAKAYALDQLGQAYRQKKAYATALQYYQRGLATLPLGFRNPALTSLPDARFIRQADQKDYLLTLIQNKANTWLDWAKVTKNNRQRFRRALETYQVADTMIDYMRWEHTGQQSKLFWRDKTRSVYEHAIETCYRLGDAEQAFRFFEKSRAVMLADQLNELGARQQLSKMQSDTEKKRRDAVSHQQGNLAGLLPSDAGYARARTVLFAKQDSLDGFLRQLEITNPAYFRYKYDNRTPSLTDLQRHLKTRQSSFVTYFRGDSALYVLGVTGDTATLHRQPVSAHTRTTQQFMDLLANPDAMNRTATVARFLMLGNELYRQLLAPLHIPAGRLIISPDGSFVPFETLSRSATHPDYLVNRYAFSYAYSANLLLRNGAAPTQTAGLVTGDFLGVAPVVFAPALGQVTLPGSDDALKLIAARFSSPTLLTHERATRRAFLTDVSAYRVIHLFTHATADTTDQEPTLYFADTTLRLSDLGDNGLPSAQLVVLAACKTGIGVIRRGEGVFSLARGFAALGVPSVLTTLWSVENKSTYAITDLFYGYLDQGLPKDIALQQAKRDWLEIAAGTDKLPNAWAGLILIGDTEPLDRPTRWPWVAGGILLVLGAGGIVLWWRRGHWVRQVSPQPQCV